MNSNNSPDVDSEPSVSPQEVIDLFKAALDKEGWIEDRVPDQFPRAGARIHSRVPATGLDGEVDCANPNQGKKRGPSKSLGVHLEQAPAKRRRADDRRN